MTSVPFWREHGAGEAVVCLHSNASSSAQWRPLANLLGVEAALAPIVGSSVN
jgi:pimeloyl-ACP methyl ester carboxylesterase